MRKTLVSLLVIIVCAGLISSCRKSVLPSTVDPGPPPHPAPPPEIPKLEETEPAVPVAVTYPVSTNIQGYYKALPKRYAESDQRYPVIIYFHGGGQYGDGNADLPAVLEEGIPKLLNEGKFPPSFTVGDEKFSFIVIAPQFTKKVGNAEIHTLFNYIKDSFRVDTSRMYLSGLSLGGRMLSDYAAYNPTEIAAVTAMGGLPQIDDDLIGKCTAMANAELPVWQFHNRDDSAWYYSEASRYIEVFRGLNPAISPRFTSFDVGEARLHHDCWTRTTDPEWREDGMNIYEWMLQYTR
jgi:predicted peptidase